MDEAYTRVIPASRAATLRAYPADVSGAVKGLAGPERLAFLDVSKGIGILLVVAGHCLDGLHGAGLIADTSMTWLAYYIIYCFHMPLFFFLAGCLVEARVKSKPKRFLRSNFTRIAYPYFLWGSIQTVILILASGAINHPGSPLIGHSLLQQIWIPHAQFWFLYVLFLLHTIAFITLKTGGRILLTMTFVMLYAACSASAPVNAFVVNYVSGTNILLYVAGVCVGGPLLARRDSIPRAGLIAGMGGILLGASAWTGWISHADFHSYLTLPAAVAGVATIIILARDTGFQHSRSLSFLGRMSMAIYVTHILFIAGTRILLVRLLHIDAVGLVMPVIFIAGILGPLAVARCAQSMRLQSPLGLG